MFAKNNGGTGNFGKLSQDRWKSFLRCVHTRRKWSLTILRRYSRELKNLNFGGYSRRINQSGACSSSDDITCGGRKSETIMEDKVIVVVCGYPDLYIHLWTFTKTGINFATRLELPGRSPSHDAYSRLLCSEFHARMKRLNSKCSSVQLGANSAIYSLHSRLVWTHPFRLRTWDYAF